MTANDARVVEQNFGKAKDRRISATTLLDCICQVTGSPSQFAGLPDGSRAVQAPDEGRNYFLRTFGRSDRKSVCACGTKSEPTLSQALHLLNGATVHQKIRQGKLVSRLLEEQHAPDAIVRSLYLRCLCREPTDTELHALNQKMTEGNEATPQALEDLFWAILNSREFVFSH